MLVSDTSGQRRNDSCREVTTHVEHAENADPASKVPSDRPPSQSVAVIQAYPPDRVSSITTSTSAARPSRMKALGVAPPR